MTQGSSIERRLRPFRKIGSASILYVDLAPCAVDATRALAWLNEEEWARWNRYLNGGSRARFAMCRAALRSILCRLLGCGNEQLAFGSSDYGKPFALVDGVPVRTSFNVSHSGNHGLIAIAPDGRLGVDVEDFSVRSDVDGLIEAVLTPKEQSDLALLQGSEKLRKFLTLWTLKEALIKALGVGLSMDMSGFEVPADMRHGRMASVFKFSHLPTVEWRLHNLGNQTFAAALAHESGDSFDPAAVKEAQAAPWP